MQSHEKVMEAGSFILMSTGGSSFILMSTGAGGVELGVWMHSVPTAVGSG